MELIMEQWRKFVAEGADDASGKAIFMAGGPGSGKSTVLSKLGLSGGISIVNADDQFEASLEAAGLSLDINKIRGPYLELKADLKAAQEAGEEDKVSEITPEYERLRAILSQQMKLFNQAQRGAKEQQVSYIQTGEDFIVDGTGGDYKRILRSKKELEEAGYKVGMVFVDVPLETSLSRNIQRGQEGSRRLEDSAVEKSWRAVDKNKQPYADLFGENFFLVDASEENFDASAAELKPLVDKFLNGTA